MITVYNDNLNLHQICRSGQCFRMNEREDGSFLIIAGKRCLKATQQGGECTFDCSGEEFDGFWREYFDLNRDYSQYISQINPNDIYLNNAARVGSGIRILHQDLWEMIVSFLISQQNNITRIRRCIQNICEKYGESCEDGQGNIYYAFPRPDALADLQDDDLKMCNLGYRSKYVVQAARRVASGEADLEKIARLSYRKAKEELLKFFGIGEKVADCICLFALHHLQAFPVDTHINQALSAHYRRGFPNRRYKGFQGVMQQYIFYYELFKNELDK